MQSISVTKNVVKSSSKLQQQFNKYIEKINFLKNQIKNEIEVNEKINHKIKNEIYPLEKMHIMATGKLILVFDKHYDDPFFKKKEKEKLSDIIINKCRVLVMAGFEEYKEVFEKHADLSYDESMEEEEIESDFETMEIIKAYNNIYEELDPEIDTPEKLLEYIEQKNAKRQEEKNAKRKPKTEQQIAKEEKLELEAKNLNKAARSIYTDLVKAFHPDKELDPDEKLRKTEIMKVITKAYENDDLYELLRLKNELQNDESLEENNIAEEKFKYYNKLLREQLETLQRELMEVQFNAHGIGKFGKDEIIIEKNIKAHAKNLKKSIKNLETETIELHDKASVRMFLKTYEIDDWY